MTDEIEAIRELTILYGSLLDRRHVDEWLDLFAEPSSLELPTASLTTTAKRRGLADHTPAGVHLVNLPVVDVAGDVATGVQTFFFWNAETATGLSGFYTDELAKVDGRWRFRRRVISFFDAGG